MKNAGWYYYLAIVLSPFACWMIAVWLAFNPDPANVGKSEVIATMPALLGTVVALGIYERWKKERGGKK